MASLLQVTLLHDVDSLFEFIEPEQLPKQVYLYSHMPNVHTIIVKPTIGIHHNAMKIGGKMELDLKQWMQGRAMVEGVNLDAPSTIQSHIHPRYLDAFSDSVNTFTLSCSHCKHWQKGPVK